MEETGEGVNKILRCHFSTMMKLDPSPQGEGPGAAILGSLPKLGNGGNHVEVRIKLDQAIEELVDDGAAIDIGHKGGVECGGIVAQHLPIYPPEFRPRFFQLRPLHGLCDAGRAINKQMEANPQGDTECYID